MLLGNNNLDEDIEDALLYEKEISTFKKKVGI